MRHLSVSSGPRSTRFCGASFTTPAWHFTLVPDSWLDGGGPEPICPACVAVSQEKDAQIANMFRQEEAK